MTQRSPAHMAYGRNLRPDSDLVRRLRPWARARVLTPLKKENHG